MISWFITSYNQDVNAKPHPRRWCMMDAYTPQIIIQDSGNWEEIEVGANFAIVKVSASSATLQTIAADTNFTRIPATLLTETLSSLTTTQKQKLQTLLNNMGYTNQEIQNALGNNLGQKTLGQVLRFITTRRVPPRFDAVSRAIVFDLAPVTCSNNIDSVDGRIQ